MIYTLICAVIEKINKDNEDRKVFEKNEMERLERQREEEELVLVLLSLDPGINLKLIQLMLFYSETI